MTWAAQLKSPRYISETPMVEILRPGEARRKLYALVVIYINVYPSGTKNFQVRIGNSVNGPFTMIASGTFPDPRLTRGNVPLTEIPTSVIKPSGQVSHM